MGASPEQKGRQQDDGIMQDGEGLITQTNAREAADGPYEATVYKGIHRTGSTIDGRTNRTPRNVDGTGLKKPKRRQVVT